MLGCRSLGKSYEFCYNSSTAVIWIKVQIYSAYQQSDYGAAHTPDVYCVQHEPIDFAVSFRSPA
jgi:hypothetical protein